MDLKETLTKLCELKSLPPPTGHREDDKPYFEIDDFYRDTFGSQRHEMCVAYQSSPTSAATPGILNKLGELVVANRHDSTLFNLQWREDESVIVFELRHYTASYVLRSGRVVEDANMASSCYDTIFEGSLGWELAQQLLDWAASENGIQR